MQKEVYSIPEKMTGYYDQSNNAMIDVWTSMLVSLEEFKTNIYDVGIDFARKNKVTTWVVDNSQAQGVYKKDVQEFIDTTVAPKCEEIGIKYFVVVMPQSAIGRLSAKNVAKINAKHKGMQILEVATAQEGFQLIKGASG